MGLAIPLDTGMSSVAGGRAGVGNVAIWLIVAFVVEVRLLQKARRRAGMCAEQVAYAQALPPASLECDGAAEDFRTLDDSIGEAFEPVIVGESLWRTGSWAGAIVTGFLIGVCAWLGVSLLAGLYSGCCLGFLPRLFQQTHYRVVPQRLDILRSTAFSSALATTSSCDIRQATIVARLDVALLTVASYGSAASTFVIDLERVAAPMALVRAMFQGVASAAEPAALPRDAFLG